MGYPDHIERTAKRVTELEEKEIKYKESLRYLSDLVVKLDGDIVKLKTALRERMCKHCGDTGSLLICGEPQLCDHCDLGNRLILEDQVQELETEIRNYLEALEYLADKSNWGGSPLSNYSILYGHLTPYELACKVLKKALLT